MKKKIKEFLKIISDIVLIYCVLTVIFIALCFLATIPMVSLPLLILAFAVETIPMVSKKSQEIERKFEK